MSRRTRRLSPRGAKALLIVLAVLTVPLIALSFAPWYFSRPRPVPAATPTAVAELTGAPFLSAPPVAHPSPHRAPSGTPLVGRPFAAGESVREMKLNGLPFTFVAPGSWGCLAATVSIDATAWRCVDEQAGDGRPQLDIVVRHCPGPCNAAQRAEADRELKYPPTYLARDPYTEVAERTVAGRYVLTLDRVFTATAGGPTDWLVVVEAQALPTDAPTVQKVVDDIHGQTVW